MKKGLAVLLVAVMIFNMGLASYAASVAGIGAKDTEEVQDNGQESEPGTKDVTGDESGGSENPDEIRDGGPQGDSAAGGIGAGSVTGGNAADGDDAEDDTDADGAGEDSTGAGSNPVTGAGGIIGDDVGTADGNGTGTVSGGDAGQKDAATVSGGDAGQKDTATVSGGNAGTVSGGDAELPVKDYFDYFEPVDFQENPSQVNVTLRTALDTARKTFVITLSRDGQEAGRGELALGGAQDKEEGEVCFADLADGTYTLTVSADGFAEYTQVIDVRRAVYEVTLTTGFEKGLSYTADALHPGVMLIGDVNGDRVVNDADRNALVDMIFAGGQSAAPACADLNGDGRVDLADLEYFTRGYRVTEDTRASVVSHIPAELIWPSTDEDTKLAQGTLQGLMEGWPVKLQPADGGEITEQNPAVLRFDVSQQVGVEEIRVQTAGENPVTDADVYVETEDGDRIKITPVKTSNQGRGLEELSLSSVTATMDENGNISINLGAQIAVKRVILVITAVKNTNLAEISKVEFLNGMEEKIPEPELDIPKGLKADGGNSVISLVWDSGVNVTGYEVMAGTAGETEIYKVTGNAFMLTSFGGKKLVNGTTYTVKVRSVNGTWRSPYCDELTVTPLATDRPKKPDNVSAHGGYRSIRVSWKDMENTDFYNLYYKKVDAEEYIEIPNIMTNSYVIEGLEDLTEYLVYVTGVNNIGVSAPSLTAAAKTTDLNPPMMPRYHLINYSSRTGEVSEHIISALMRVGCKMIDSPLDEADSNPRSAWGTVDNDPGSYYQTAGWDEGGFNALGAQAGLTYTFDKAYKMDTIALYTQPGHDFTYYRVRYWDENGTAADLNVTRLAMKDADGRSYYLMKFKNPVMATKIQIGFGAYLASSPQIRVGEVYFYHYDELMDEIFALYEDALHTTLRPDVDQGMIDDLRVRINEKDEVSGEYNPNLEALERELQTAEDILNNESLGDATTVHCGIYMDANRGFSGLNAWQPLGVTAAAGEEITIYVGHSSMTTGQTTDLSLVVTQYYSESGGVSQVVGGNLKIGANILTIPQIGSLYDQESGGALYVACSGKNNAGQYAVRVGGGVQVPVLDLYQVTDHDERIKRAESYLAELDAYVGAMEANHQKYHLDSGNKLVAKAYEQTTCILGASDILLDSMLFSLPAPQILNGCGGSAEKLVASMDSMEDMMHLFYQHKGLNDSAEDLVDQVPKAHLNIRYQRMFAGAFMYAAGNHIGIEWGSAPGMVSSPGVVYGSDGKYVSGWNFGWGVAHEIGHNINQGAYAIAETTNNYFSVLAQAKDTNDSVRFRYEEVYKKVTSGTQGPASNVFTQLGMYWQLHLAYDKGYNYKTYEDYNQQLANLFFARVDTYARTPSKAPGTLTLSGGTDQVLMRLACAAAGKNILEFFERWGKVPDEDTVKYASQFERETRAIFYACDEARVYSLTGKGSMLGTDGRTEAVADGVTAAISPDAANQVIITLGHKANIPDADVLGYEIVRCTISGGDVVKEPAGFAQDDTFTDTITTMNNRTVYYEVTLVDKYLNRSAVKTLNSVKVEHEGDLDKEFWTVAISGLTVADSGLTGNDDMPCTPEEDSWKALVDNDASNSYSATAGGNAEIVLEFNRTCTISGFRYRGVSVSSGCAYEIQVRQEGASAWLKVAEGQFGATASDGKIYFSHDEYVNTYGAAAVKLVLKTAANSRVEIGELDVLGVTGDNVDFRRTGDGTPAIGIMAADYRFGTGADDVIPKNAIVFTGSFKGNPAYNVVMLFDQNGNLVGGSVKDENGNGRADQIILAKDPADGQEIQNVYDGTWFYWIAPAADGSVDTKALEGVKKVRAELYRVNDALTNEDQRLVSDSLYEEVPSSLPTITIKGDSNTR